MALVRNETIKSVSTDIENRKSAHSIKKPHMVRTDDTRSGRADGVAQRHSTTVHVHLGQVQVQQSAKKGWKIELKNEKYHP